MKFHQKRPLTMSSQPCCSDDRRGRPERNWSGRIEVGPLDENLDVGIILNIVKLQGAELRDEILNKGVILILRKLQGVEFRDRSLMEAENKIWLKMRSETRGP